MQICLLGPFARDGFLPAVFARIHPTYRTPAILGGHSAHHAHSHATVDRRPGQDPRAPRGVRHVPVR